MGEQRPAVHIGDFAPSKYRVVLFWCCGKGGFHRLVYTKGHKAGTQLMLPRDKDI
jgi:hypothetical protein